MEIFLFQISSSQETPSAGPACFSVIASFYSRSDLISIGLPANAFQLREKRSRHRDPQDGKLVLYENYSSLCLRRGKTPRSVEPRCFKFLTWKYIEIFDSFLLGLQEIHVKSGILMYNLYKDLP